MFYLLLLTISLSGVSDDTNEYKLKRYQDKKHCISAMMEMREKFSDIGLKHFNIVVSCKEIR